MSLLRRADTDWLMSPEQDAMRASGGMWIPAANTIKTREVIAEAAERGVRALTVHEITPELAQQLPDLEFLGCGKIDPDLSLITPLYKLRSLSFDAFAGKLDLAAFPHLEWLSFDECDRNGLDALRDGHPSLWSLRAGTYPGVDLRLVEHVRLRSLKIINSRRLTSLAGVEALRPTLTKLELSICPNLASLDGIESLSSLEALELGGLRHVTTLDLLAQLPKLRLLAIADLRNVESLKPLAHHPSLEFVALGRTMDCDLDPLATLPGLRLVVAGARGWNHDITAFPYFHNYRPEDEPAKEEYRRLMHF